MTIASDAVVIGAGHNGLVAANLLADAGWDVLVLEATAAPGGAVRTAEITAPGFRSDLCSAFYPLGAASPALRGARAGGATGCAGRTRPAVLAHVLPDGRRAVLVPRPRAHRRVAGGVRAGRRRRVAGRYARLAADPRRRCSTRCCAPFPPVRAGRAAAARAAARRSCCGWPGSLTAAGARRSGEERFAGDGAQAAARRATRCTPTSAPDEAGSGVFGWLLAMLGQHVGFPVPVGGAGRDHRRAGAPAAPTGAARVDCGRPVDRVLVARRPGAGRARRGRRAGAGPPGGARRRAGADALPATWSAPAHLPAAAASPTWRLPVGRRHGQGRLGAVRAGAVDGAGRSAGRRHRPPRRRPGRADRLRDGPRRAAGCRATRSCCSGQMTTADPTRSPAGTESVWAYTHVPRGEQWPADATAAPARRPDRAGDGDARAGLPATWSWAGTSPARPTWRRDNPSLVGGAINGGTRGRAPAAGVPRPVPGPGPGRHPDRPAVPGQRVGPPGRRRARRGRRERGPRGAGPQRNSAPPTDREWQRTHPARS